MTAGRTAEAGATLIGGVVLFGLVLLVLKWALITAAVLVVPFGVWWCWDRARSRRSLRSTHARETAAQERRQELEARVTIDAGGGCGWCGSRIAHEDARGALVHPLDHHRAEIEDQLSTESTHRR